MPIAPLTNLSSLPGSEVFDVIDSTKIKCFKDCPRKFFYNFVLHWRRSEPNIHLEFGTAWHLAKEHLLTTSYTAADVDEAYSIFLSHFRKYFSEHDDLTLDAKTPGNAKKALTEYAKQFGPINRQMTILATEIAGQVALSHDLMVSFKIDAVVRDSRGVWVLDHKTSSRDSPIYDESWFLSEQMSVYTHALHCMFPTENVRGAYVDLSVLRKSGNLHKRLPVTKTFNHLEEWHWNILQWFHFLQREYTNLTTNTHSTTLEAFPKNTESCTKYGRCPYMSLCSSCFNPIPNIEDIPEGFRREVWNPHAGDKSWRPKHIMSPDGELRTPTPEELYAFEQSAKAREEAQKSSELDTFTFEGFI